MLVELGLVEQPSQAVLEIIDEGYGHRCRPSLWVARQGGARVASRVCERRVARLGRSDVKRWERSRAMDLWQMDIVGGVRLVDGSEGKIVSGIDDHSDQTPVLALDRELPLPSPLRQSEEQTHRRGVNVRRR
jgi:hypothetical protein